MNPRIKPWTQEENKRLKRFATDGVTTRAAAAMNRTIRSVQAQAKKLGIRFPTLIEQRKKLGGSPVSRFRFAGG